MSSNTTRGFKGYAEVMKVSGSGPITNGVQIGIPFLQCSPRNPNNDTYPPVVNKSAYPSVIIAGKYTPSMSLRTVAKQSWFTANWLNTLILTADANDDTDLLAIRSVEGATTTIYDGCRCGSLSLSHNAAGGGIGVEMGFIGTDPTGSTSFTGSGSIDAGQALNAALVDYGGAATADLVREWRLNLFRPQAYDFFSNRSREPSGVSTGQLGGTLELVQSAKASTIPTTTMTIRIYAVDNITLLMTLTLKLNLDEPVYERTVGFGSKVNAYSLIDASAGGANITIA